MGGCGAGVGRWQLGRLGSAGLTRRGGLEEATGSSLLRMTVHGTSGYVALAEITGVEEDGTRIGLGLGICLWQLWSAVGLGGSEAVETTGGVVGGSVGMSYSSAGAGGQSAVVERAAKTRRRREQSRGAAAHISGGSGGSGGMSGGISGGISCKQVSASGQSGGGWPQRTSKLSKT